MKTMMVKPRYSVFGNLMPQPGPDVDPMAIPPVALGPAIGQRPPVKIEVEIKRS
jgi:hypothetical protein